MADESTDKKPESGKTDDPALAHVDAVRPAIKWLQEVQGEKSTGAYDDVRKTVNDVLTKVAQDYMLAHGLIGLKGEGGAVVQTFRIGKNGKFDGKFYESHNGAFDETPAGAITEMNHAAVAEMMKIALNDYVDDTRDTLPGKIDRSQRAKLTALGVPPDQQDAALKALHDSSNDIGEAREKMRVYLSGENTNSTFFYQLWQLEMASRGHAAYPLDLLDDKNFLKMAAVHDIVQGLSGGQPSDTRAELRGGANLPKPDDRYFPAELYKIDFMFHINSGIEPGTKMDGALIGHPGETFPAEEGRKLACKMALDKCLADLDRLGIPRHEFTKALFEGRENVLPYKPSHNDLKLIYTALGNNNAERIHNWNATFGSLDVGTVMTRITSGDYLKPDRAAITVNMTTDDILERMTHGGRMDRTGADGISRPPSKEALLNNFCAYQYFNFEDHGTGNNHLAGDYAELRDNVYYLQVQRREAGQQAVGVEHLLETAPEKPRPAPDLKIADNNTPAVMIATAGGGAL